MDCRDGYLMLDLTPHFNNDGISSDADLTDGAFTPDGFSYPEEDLPESNTILEVDGVVFRFPDKRDGVHNNVSLEGQRICVPEGLYDCLYLLGASECISLEDTLHFTFADGSHGDTLLGLTSWDSGHSLSYGETVAIRCDGYHYPLKHVDTRRTGNFYGMWMQNVTICAHRPLVAILLPDNPAMHIFAITLHRGCPS